MRETDIKRESGTHDYERETPMPRQVVSVSAIVGGIGTVEKNRHDSISARAVAAVPQEELLGLCLADDDAIHGFKVRRVRSERHVHRILLKLTWESRRNMAGGNVPSIGRIQRARLLPTASPPKHPKKARTLETRQKDATIFHGCRRVAQGERTHLDLGVGTEMVLHVRHSVVRLFELIANRAEGLLHQRREHV